MKIMTKIQIATATSAIALATVPSASAAPVERPADALATTTAKTAAVIHPEAAKFEVERDPKPKPEKKAEPAVPQAENGMIEGVSVATLESIAACESGGDPTAVNAAGYYGKYQFDEATWASVGGSGNPAEAPEAEQDYRAALLYAQAGSSPWPVCGS